MVLGLSTGILGSTVLLRCKLGGAQPSLWAFMAGSLAYIFSEMAGANAHQAHLKAQAVELEEFKKKLQEGDSLQRVALEGQLQTEKNNLEFVKKRKGWMYAVGAIYALATTLAIIEATAEVATLGVKNSVAGCSSPDAKVTWASGLLRGSLIAAFMGASVNSSGVQSGWVSGGIGLGSALMLIKPVSEFMDKILGFLIDHGVSRSITFGSFMLVSAATIVDLEMTQNTIEKNIEDITTVLIAQYPTAPPSGVATGSGAEALGNNVSGVSSNYSLKKLDGFYAVAPVPCASNSGGSFSVNTSNCKKPLKVNRPNLNTGFSDNFLQGAVNTAGDFTEAVAAGNMARAEVLAGSLSNMAGRLKIERDNALKKFNQIAKQNKKKAIDFDKEVKAFNESMSGKLTKSLASQGIDPKSMMKASTGADKKPMAAVSPAATPVTGAPEVPVTDLAATAETPTEETASAPTPTLEESLEQFESNESDISPEKQVSIFKQVSNRYILNFNRFFKEETPVSEAPVPSEPKDPAAQQPTTQPVK